jgi:hypothetical protein
MSTGSSEVQQPNLLQHGTEERSNLCIVHATHCVSVYTHVVDTSTVGTAVEPMFTNLTNSIKARNVQLIISVMIDYSLCSCLGALAW